MEKEIKLLQEQVVTLQKEKDGAMEKIALLEKDAALGIKFREQLRNETEALYRLIKGPQASNDFIDGMIKNSPVENVHILKSEYETELSSKLFVTCPHCGKQIHGLRASKEPEKTARVDEKQAEQHKV